MINKLLERYLRNETVRQNEGLELIASENFASREVRNLCGSVLTNKYAEGFPGKRYYGGCQNIDDIEQLAIDLLCQLFDAKYANVQPHSGSSANMITYYALLNPGDTILSLSLDEGGHLTHGSPVNFSAKYYQILHYHLGNDARIDYDKLEELALEKRPQMILAGFSAYPFEIDFARISAIAKKINAIFMVDMAHIAGLIAGGVHSSPIPYADVVTSTTHKTLRGPRGGIILTNNEEIIKKINKATFPGLQGGPLENIIGAKAQCFYEASLPTFKDYARAIVTNTKMTANTFAQLGDVVSGTENHLFLLNTKKSFGLTGLESEKMLEEINVTVNKNMLPGDQERPSITSGIRIGLAALTTRGLDEAGAEAVAQLIHDFLSQKINKEEAQTRVQIIVKKLKNIEEL
ncbi:serine hydroxymethyltransferase [Trichlorobacter sp.]|jgi:glycine hydroxymethyltransferase|uniref:serine hydroxymethyltransferase n=1 Tax=Trichlorobacter sp. TaxID=2911007 RepID=UPI002A35AEE9|nr:serine hydroxymethyltransferase [Trichlorobacter sp.]MDD2398967.1 serine hydroxymethyltransferase [Bacilli bacterium]MDD4344483.1 serine hydroxymethyltransferase [Bacilli bacterium]MDD4469277.1 serine hydroxymethyltransferase [Acholeplasmataceae bacterium]MDY0385485.1 serine hydroxymethyltransferase [Trichlorobacter sp.]